MTQATGIVVLRPHVVDAADISAAGAPGHRFTAQRAKHRVVAELGRFVVARGAPPTQRVKLGDRVMESNLDRLSRPSLAGAGYVAAVGAPLIREHSRPSHPRGNVLARVRAAALSWRARRRQRVELASLDPWMLRDLGLGEADLWRELNKYPWQA